MRSPYLRFSIIGFALGFFVVLMGIQWFQMSWLWAYLLGVNVATFLLYGYDKAAARNNGLRVPERVLHGAEILGGTPAGFLGQRIFHHKSSKGSYQVTFWIIVAVQVILLIALIYLGLT